VTPVSPRTGRSMPSPAADLRLQLAPRQRRAAAAADAGAAQRFKLMPTPVSGRQPAATGGAAAAERLPETGSPRDPGDVARDSSRPVTKVKLKTLPRRAAEVLLSERLRTALAELPSVPGVEALARVAASGRLFACLRLHEASDALAEEDSSAVTPVLWLLLREAQDVLQLATDVELRLSTSRLPRDHDLLLLQVRPEPRVCRWMPGAGGRGPALLRLARCCVTGAALRTCRVHARPQLPTVASDMLHVLTEEVGSRGAGGWRRRAVILVGPAFARACSELDPDDGLRREELLAALGATLAPMAMPGGGGWRLGEGTSTLSAAEVLPCQ
jgi:hypothetical protein